MRLKGQIESIDELIQFASECNGCYAEYQYSKKLHAELVELADGWEKTGKTQREYWKDIDKENTQWRIILR